MKDKFSLTIRRTFFSSFESIWINFLFQKKKFISKNIWYFIRMNDELENLREFYDPDTVDLMQWIQQNTGQVSSVSWYSWSYAMDTAEYRTGEFCILIQLILCNGYSRIQDRGVLYPDTVDLMQWIQQNTGQMSSVSRYSWYYAIDTVDLMQWIHWIWW